jgi:hypothetical protein
MIFVTSIMTGTMDMAESSSERSICHINILTFSKRPNIIVMHLTYLVDVDPTGLRKIRYAPDLCSRGALLELRQDTDCPALPAGFRGFSQSMSSNWEVSIYNEIFFFY